MPRLGLGLGLSARTIIATSAGPLPPEPGSPLSVYRDEDPYGPDSLFNTYAGPTANVENMEDDACNPVRLVDGSAVTDLTFSSCAANGNFSITSLSEFQGSSLTNLTFSNCAYGGYGDFTLSDTTGLTSLTNLNIDGCGRFGYANMFSIPAISSLITLNINNSGLYNNGILNLTGFSSITNLSISSSSGYGLLITTSVDNDLTTLAFNNVANDIVAFDPFSINSVAGLQGLTTCSFDSCGTAYGGFSIVDYTTVLNESAATVLLEAVDNGTNIAGNTTAVTLTLRVNSITPGGALETVIGNLTSKSYYMDVTVAP